MVYLELFDKFSLCQLEMSCRAHLLTTKVLFDHQGLLMNFESFSVEVVLLFAIMEHLKDLSLSVNLL